MSSPSTTSTCPRRSCPTSWRTASRSDRGPRPSCTPRTRWTCGPRAAPRGAVPCVGGRRRRRRSGRVRRGARLAGGAQDLARRLRRSRRVDAGRAGGGGRGARAASAGTRGEWLVEQFVAFTRELAALVARSPCGQVAVYPVVRTVQTDGICTDVVAPCPGLSDDRDPGRPGAGAADRRGAGRGRHAGRRTVRHPRGRWWSTSWRCVRTTPVTGRSTGRSPANSRTTCARCWTCRWVPDARAPCTVMVNVLGG